MNNCILLLSLILCSSGTLDIANAQKRQTRDLINPLTLGEVRQVEKKLPRLKKGMSPNKVLKVLGLDRYRIMETWSSGPPKNYTQVYQLGSGYNLALTFDYSQGYPGKFITGGLVKWNKDRDTK
ncbi:MAG TPA: hypothetical protein VF717_13585 [Pyrinomonadaceae bacterium]